MFPPKKQWLSSLDLDEQINWVFTYTELHRLGRRLGSLAKIHSNYSETEEKNTITDGWPAPYDVLNF